MNGYGTSAEPAYSALTDAELVDYVWRGFHEAFGILVSAATLVEKGGEVMRPGFQLHGTNGVFQGALRHLPAEVPAAAACTHRGFRFQQRVQST